jgi:hypothetical protein
LANNSEQATCAPDLSLSFASWQRSFNTTTLTLSFFAFSSLLHVVKRDKTPLMIDLSGIEEL